MKHRLAAGVLLAVVVVVYLPGLSNGFVWDDNQLIVDNKELAGDDYLDNIFVSDFWSLNPGLGTRSDYYRPLVSASYWLDWKLHGLSPWGFHLTNVVIHAFVTVLLFVFLRGLDVHLAAAFTSALLFGVHPALMESVAWISGRTDSLAGLFLIFFLVADQRSARFQWALAALLGLVSGLLAKEMAIVFPVIAVFFGIARGETLTQSIRGRLYTLPLLVAYFVVRLSFLGSTLTADPHVSLALSFGERLLFLLHLASLLVNPAGVRVDYGIDVATGSLVLGAVLGASVLVFVAFYAWRARSRNTLLAWLTAAAMVALLPSAAAVFLKSILGDRLLYVPSFFLLPAIVIVVFHLLPGRVFPIAAALAAMALASLTLLRLPVWKSDETLFTSAMTNHPSGLTFLALASLKHKNGDLAGSLDLIEQGIESLEEAREEETRAFERYPGSATGRIASLLGVRLDRRWPWPRLAASRFLAGSIAQLVGCEADAERHYRETLALDPGHVEAVTNYTALLAEHGRLVEARDLARRALPHSMDKLLASNYGRMLEIEPSPPTELRACPGRTMHDTLRDPGRINKRAFEFIEKDQLSSAEALVLAAEKLSPEDPATRMNRARLLLVRGELDAASEVLSRLIPDDSTGEALRLSRRLNEVRASP